MNPTTSLQMGGKRAAESYRPSAHVLGILRLGLQLGQHNGPAHLDSYVLYSTMHWKPGKNLVCEPVLLCVSMVLTRTNPAMGDTHMSRGVSIRLPPAGINPLRYVTLR